MKSNPLSFRARATAGWLAAFFSLALAGGVQAQKHPTGKVEVAPGARAVLANNSAEAGLLRAAYLHLATADHDYKGHRIKAMKQIEAAAKHLGVNLHGDGRDHEAQRTSDEHLRVAQQLLAQIVGVVAGEGLKHIRLAVEQLNVALAIR